MKRPEKNQSGVALMVVLWIIVLLTALATEFVSAMKTEVHTTRNYKEDIESYNLAKAGINLAMAELLKTARFHSSNSAYGFIVGKVPILSNQPQVSNQANQTSEPVAEFDIIQRTDIPLGAGTVSYTIQDENGKVNVNTASRELLIKVLMISGVEVGELRDVIADSILDWIDSDDNFRLNGAETEYYQSLNPPYKPKNGAIHSVDELIRVKGITEEILYGSAQTDSGATYVGLDKFLTVLNVSSVNPNTASPQILSLYYPPEQVRQIVETREIKGYFSNTVSTHFKITATGRIANSKTNHTVVAIIEKLGNTNEATLLIRYWNDNAINL